MGSVHISVNRHFVRYAVSSPVAKDFTQWLQPTHIPDETLFATLHRNKQLAIPGSHSGKGQSRVLHGLLPFHCLTTVTSAPWPAPISLSHHSHSVWYALKGRSRFQARVTPRCRYVCYSHSGSCNTALSLCVLQPFRLV